MKIGLAVEHVWGESVSGARTSDSAKALCIATVLPSVGRKSKLYHQFPPEATTDQKLDDAHHILVRWCGEYSRLVVRSGYGNVGVASTFES